jgi:hypothetical protein
MVKKGVFNVSAVCSVGHGEGSEYSEATNENHVVCLYSMTHDSQEFVRDRRDEVNKFHSKNYLSLQAQIPGIVVEQVISRIIASSISSYI